MLIQNVSASFLAAFAAIGLVTTLNAQQPSVTRTQANAALRKAALQGQMPAAQAAVAKGANVNAKNADGVTPLMLASAKGHKDLVLFLLSKGATVDEVTTADKVSALMFAAYWGHTAVVDALLDKGAKIDLEDGGKRNVIDWAGAHDSVQVPQAKALVAHLKERGAQPKKSDALGLFLSVGSRPELAKFLETAAAEK
jgi:serine/threonine-protein phosphatase 6 regulatory ankyrin repeat subunit B